MKTFFNIIFWPITFLIEKIGFNAEWMLVVLLAPDLFVAFMLFHQSTVLRETYLKESHGVAYITPLARLLTGLEDRRALWQDPDQRTKLDAATAVVDADIEQAEKVDAQYGAELSNEQFDSSKKWKEISGDWIKMKYKTYTDPNDYENDHSALTAKVNDLVQNYVASTSTLILDPDLDSYNLMDSYCNKLTNLPDFIGQVNAAAVAAIAAGKITSEERVTIAGIASQIDSNRDGMLNDLNIAIGDNEKYTATEQRTGNGSLRPALLKPYQDMVDQLKAYTAMLHDQIEVVDTATATPGQIVAKSRDCIAKLDALSVASGPLLDRLCVERADLYGNYRLRGIITALCAALAISYVFSAFARSVRRARARLEAEHAGLQGNILGLLTVVSSAASGDLRVRAQVTEGALGNVADAFNQMLEHWQELMGAINTQLDLTNRSIAELAASSEKMAGGASRQATELTAASDSVQRMATDIVRVSANAVTAAEAAARTQESAQQGSRSVADVITGMETLRASVQAGAKKIKSLGDRSMEINSIVATITKISEQTNMLALNAAIEAARAGDQGRGFSVVADEVRKLAERTATATMEIDKLVRAIQAETNESVDAIEKQTQVVEEEGKAVAGAGSALARIRDVSSQSSGLISDIAAVARTQVEGASLMGTTMKRISEIARDTETGAQGSQVITQKLAALSQELRTSIGRFKIA